MAWDQVLVLCASGKLPVAITVHGNLPRHCTPYQHDMAPWLLPIWTCLSLVENTP